MTDFSVTQYNPYNMYQNFGYNPAFRGATVPQNNYNSVPQMTQQPDTVSFSASNKLQQPKKEGMSTGTKIAIGASVLTALTVGADFSRHQYATRKTHGFARIARVLVLSY